VDRACQCQPYCWGRSCGDDGCGGSCGECPAGQPCGTDGRCVCTPSCGDRECGDDGCGGLCGSCESGELCSAGRCEVCAPMCTGRECGPNGCGGSCGSCGEFATCEDGRCERDPDACDPVTNTGCLGANECLIMSDETTRCALAGHGTQGSSCSTTADCDGGFGCFARTCRKICRLASGVGCPDDLECASVAGYRTYGVCADPA
jgi:hypothetical protein